MQQSVPIGATHTMRTNHENDADMTPREVRELEQEHQAFLKTFLAARRKVQMRYFLLQRRPESRKLYEESLKELRMACARLENFRAKTRLQPPMRKARCRNRPSAKHRRAFTSVAVSFHFNKKK